MNLTTFKVGFFLARKRIARTSMLTNGLVIFVMLLTFLNLIFVRGILIGLPDGAVKANNERYYGDIFISAKENKKHIQVSKPIIDILNDDPNVQGYSVRYLTGGSVSTDFSQRIRQDERLDQVNATFMGIDSVAEESTMNVSNYLLEGTMFPPRSKDEIVLGKNLVSKYESPGSDASETLDNVNIGSEVEIKIGEITKKVKVTGFLYAKVTNWDRRVIMSQELLREFLDPVDFKPDEIAVVLKDEQGIEPLKEELLDSGIEAYATVETSDEYQPSFVVDIIQTFAILGDVIGSIGLVVASITVFIVVFVNAVTDRKFIGILKGIGIDGVAIEISYIIQSVFYSVIGSFLGIFLIYVILIPYFLANPIDFPFSDGYLVAEFPDTVRRTVALFIATVIAGYIPARSIVKQNTLKAILGR